MRWVVPGTSDTHELDVMPRNLLVAHVYHWSYLCVVESWPSVRMCVIPRSCRRFECRTNAERPCYDLEIVWHMFISMRHACRTIFNTVSFDCSESEINPTYTLLTLKILLYFFNFISCHKLLTHEICEFFVLLKLSFENITYL